jgi:hypothetical protein
MTTHFTFRPTGDTVYELEDEYTMAEITWVHKALNLDIGDIGNGLRTMVGMYLCVRRSDPRRWNGKAWDGLLTGDFAVVDDPNQDGDVDTDQGGDVDPTDGRDNEKTQSLT